MSLKEDLLFKKALGFRFTTMNRLAPGENIVDTKIQNSQIFSQTIPSTQPTEWESAISIGLSSKRISTKYPYIAKYENILMNKVVTNNTNSWEISDNHLGIGPDILKNAIIHKEYPWNFLISGDATIYTSSQSKYPAIINNGVLIFFDTTSDEHGVQTKQPPSTITLKTIYIYEGKMGLNELDISGLTVQNRILIGPSGGAIEASGNTLRFRKNRDASWSEFGTGTGDGSFNNVDVSGVLNIKGTSSPTDGPNIIFKNVDKQGKIFLNADGKIMVEHEGEGAIKIGSGTSGSSNLIVSTTSSGIFLNNGLDIPNVTMNFIDIPDKVFETVFGFTTDSVLNLNTDAFSQFLPLTDKFFIVNKVLSSNGRNNFSESDVSFNYYYKGYDINEGDNDGNIDKYKKENHENNSARFLNEFLYSTRSGGKVEEYDIYNGNINLNIRHSFINKWNFIDISGIPTFNKNEIKIVTNFKSSQIILKRNSLDNFYEHIDDLSQVTYNFSNNVRNGKHRLINFEFALGSSNTVFNNDLISKPITNWLTFNPPNVNAPDISYNKDLSNIVIQNKDIFGDKWLIPNICPSGNDTSNDISNIRIYFDEPLTETDLSDVHFKFYTDLSPQQSNIDISKIIVSNNYVNIELSGITLNDASLNQLSYDFSNNSTNTRIPLADYLGNPIPNFYKQIIHKINDNVSLSLNSAHIPYTNDSSNIQIVLNFNNDISYGYPFTDISGDWEITKSDETSGTVDISNIERMKDNSNNLYKLIISLSGETLADINDGKIYDISFSTDSSNIKMLNGYKYGKNITTKTINNYLKFKEAYKYYHIKSYDISLASSSTNNFFSASFNKTILDVSNNVYVTNNDFKYKANQSIDDLSFNRSVLNIPDDTDCNIQVRFYVGSEFDSSFNKKSNWCEPMTIDKKNTIGIFSERINISQTNINDNIIDLSFDIISYNDNDQSSYDIKLIAESSYIALSDISGIMPGALDPINYNFTASDISMNFNIGDHSGKKDISNHFITQGTIRGIVDDVDYNYYGKKLHVTDLKLNLNKLEDFLIRDISNNIKVDISNNRGISSETYEVKFPSKKGEDGLLLQYIDSMNDYKINNTPLTEASDITLHDSSYNLGHWLSYSFNYFDNTYYDISCVRDLSLSQTFLFSLDNSLNFISYTINDQNLQKITDFKNYAYSFKYDNVNYDISFSFTDDISVNDLTGRNYTLFSNRIDSTVDNFTNGNFYRGIYKLNSYTGQYSREIISNIFDASNVHCITDINNKKATILRNNMWHRYSASDISSIDSSFNINIKIIDFINSPYKLTPYPGEYWLGVSSITKLKVLNKGYKKHFSYDISVNDFKENTLGISPENLFSVKWSDISNLKVFIGDNSSNNLKIRDLSNITFVDISNVINNSVRIYTRGLYNNLKDNSFNHYYIPHKIDLSFNLIFNDNGLINDDMTVTREDLKIHDLSKSLITRDLGGCGLIWLPDASNNHAFYTLQGFKQEIDENEYSDVSGLHDLYNDISNVNGIFIDISDVTYKNIILFDYNAFDLSGETYQFNYNIEEWKNGNWEKISPTDLKDNIDVLGFVFFISQTNETNLFFDNGEKNYYNIKRFIKSDKMVYESNISSIYDGGYEIHQHYKHNTLGDLSTNDSLSDILNTIFNANDEETQEITACLNEDIINEDIYTITNRYKNLYESDGDNQKIFTMFLFKEDSKFRIIQN